MISGLIPLHVVANGRMPSHKERILGRSARARAEIDRLTADTHQGRAEIFRADRRIHVELAGARADAGPVSSSVAIAEARRGLTGAIGGTPLTIRRPRFGLRLVNRSAHLDAGAIQLRSHMFSPRRFAILRAATDDVVLVSDHGRTQIEASLTPDDLIATLLFAQCGIIQGSSFINLFVL